MMIDRSSARIHFLSREQQNIHCRWNKDRKPVAQINSGDLITIETRDAANGHFTRESTAKDILTRDTDTIHPLTGPVFVHEAEPGDVLKIDILDFDLGDWGWSATGSGKGLLPDLLSKDFFTVWKYDAAKQYAWLNERTRVKIAPFCGVMGVAWDEAGEFPTGPPRKNGGNMDIRYLTAGSSLHLPVFVKGGLFSAGDGHAAQGDGEVSISAIETELTVSLRISLIKGVSIQEPQYETADYFATTGFGTTIIEASKKATHYMVEYITSKYKLSIKEAYVLCTAAMDLKICETVDLPHYLVSAHIPKEIFI